jgi:hypothetical protein
MHCKTVYIVQEKALTLRSNDKFRVIAPGLLKDIDDAKLDLLHFEAQHPISLLLVLYEARGAAMRNATKCNRRQLSLLQI